MTEKLFYKDSYQKTFTAKVLDCREAGDFYEVVVDKTVFFPEGGGQSADIGVLGGARVLDVQEKDGVIYHTTDGALAVGETVDGEIDWNERFSRMQQHTGEHIVSGIVHKMFGYNNVGFHLGADYVTLDFDGPVTKEQMREIEYLANEAVAKNVPVEILYPSKEELANMEYRSKIEIEGQVRIVVVTGYDVCACCAPQLQRTGEVGGLKLVGMQNYKGGVRMSMLCGFRALEDYNEKEKSVKEISVLLSVKEHEVAEEVVRLKEQLLEKKNEIAGLERKLMEYQVNAVDTSRETVCMFGLSDAGMARESVNLLLEKGVKTAAAFAGDDSEGYKYVLGSRSVDVRPAGKALNEKFAGRGGGKPEMVQGSIAGTREEIGQFFETLETVCPVGR